MKNLRVFPIAVFLCLTSVEAKVGIKESYESALKNNQADNINQARINESYELKKRFESGYIPVLSGRGSYQKQDNSDSATNLGLNLSHTIYNGGQDYEEVQNAKTAIKIAENQKEIDRIVLYQNVITAYYEYVLNLNDMDNLSLLKKQSQDRVNEIRKRVQIGRSRRGELMQAEAQLASVDAQFLNGQGLINQSRERFYILTGIDRNEPIDYLAEAREVPQDLGVEEYLTKALGREDVRNRQLQIELSERQLKLSKTYYLPTLDFASNYYINKTGGTAASRKSDWDVALVLNVPILGGGTSYRVQESVERKQAAIYELSDYEKAVRLDVTAKYETYRRYNDQIKAYDMALQKGKNSYDETLKDYRLGLISNLDVLSSLNLYLDSKRNSEKTKIQAVMTHKLLEASAGVLP